MTPKQIAEGLLAGSDVKLAGLDEAEFHEVLYEVQAIGKARAVVPPSDAETLRSSLSAAVQRAEKAEDALDETKTELRTLRTENAELKSKDADFENRVGVAAAKMVCDAGIRPFVPTAATAHTSKPTATELCIQAKAAEAAIAPTPVPPSSDAAQADDEE